METGTPIELKLSEGDVIECVSWDGFMFAPGDRTTINESDPIVSTDCGTWRIISRAQPTPDLTAITTPFGLLDEATQEALRAHGGPYEIFTDGCGWTRLNPEWFNSMTYRVSPTTTIETETMKIINADGMPMAYGTVETHNGKPQWGTLKVEPR